MMQIHDIRSERLQLRIGLTDKGHEVEDQRMRKHKWERRTGYYQRFIGKGPKHNRAFKVLEDEWEVNKGRNYRTILKWIYAISEQKEIIIDEFWYKFEPYKGWSYRHISNMLWKELPLHISSIIRGFTALHEEMEKWKKEALQQYPTPEAYNAACKALNKKTDRLTALREEMDTLRDWLVNAADVMEQHIDEPQAVSHAELRDTAKSYRAAALSDQKEEKDD